MSEQYFSTAEYEKSQVFKITLAAKQFRSLIPIVFYNNMNKIIDMEAKYSTIF